MPATAIKLKILLPSEIFLEKTDISQMTVETSKGSFGILPQRLDCVAVLVPGILSYRNKAGEDLYIALDEGVLVKTNGDVLISVRNAVSGTDLKQLRKAVDQEFLKLNEQEKNARSVMMKMESSFISQLAEFHHD